MTTSRAQREAAIVRAVWGVTGVLLLGCTTLVVVEDSTRDAGADDLSAPALAAPAAPPTLQVLPVRAPAPGAVLTSTAPPLPGLVAAPRPRRVVVVRRSRAS